jgi:hypothetical protein
LFYGRSAILARFIFCGVRVVALLLYDCEPHASPPDAEADRGENDFDASDDFDANDATDDAADDAGDDSGIEEAGDP